MRKRPNECSALTLPSASWPGRALDEDSLEAKNLQGMRVKVVGAEVCTGLLPPHTLFIGSSGSGKSLSQEVMMASLLPDRKQGLAYRCVLFDPKVELYPTLVELGIDPRHIIVTHPFDERCVGWHLADDFTEDAHARTLAHSFFPLREGANSRKVDHEDFWHNASNIVVAVVVSTLIKILPGLWELRDVIEICSRLDILKQVLKKTASGKKACAAFFEPKDASRSNLPHDVMATLYSRLSKFETLGALLHRCKTVFSIKRWRAGSGIILMGHDTERKAVMQLYNNLLIKRMSESVVHQTYPKDPVDLTWFLFDELVEAGEFDGFHTFLNYGRGKGIRVVLGFCDIAGLEKTFANHESILSLCSTKVFFNLGSAKTATWAAEQCGRIPKDRDTTSTAPNGDVTHQKGEEEQYRIRPHKFMDLPLSRGGRLEGFAVMPGMAAFHTVLADVNKYLPRIAKTDPRCFVPRRVTDQEPLPWGRDDYEALGIGPSNGEADDAVKPLSVFRL